MSIVYIIVLNLRQQNASYWFAGCTGEFNMEVQFGLSRDGRGENDLKFDAFKGSNLTLSDLREQIIKKPNGQILTFINCFLKKTKHTQ